MTDWLTKRLEVEIPPRCTQHQCVKGAAFDPSGSYKGCITCERYHLNLNTETCLTCLASEHLDHYQPDPWFIESLEKLKRDHAKEATSVSKPGIPKGYRETTVYTYRGDPVTKKSKIDRVRGLEEDKPFNFQYYWHKGSEKWFAIDKMTGRSIASGATLKEVHDIAHSEERMAAFDTLSKTEAYGDMVAKHYKAMVECGAYVELH